MRCNHLLVYKRTVEGILAGMRTERSFGGPRGDFNQGIVGRLGLGTYTCTEVLPLSFSLSLSLSLSLLHSLCLGIISASGTLAIARASVY